MLLRAASLPVDVIPSVASDLEMRVAL